MIVDQQNLLNSFEPFIENIVRKTKKSTHVLDFDDLRQIGRIAAFEAMSNYDATRGSSFRSYVKSTIRQAILCEAGRIYDNFILPRGVLHLATRVYALDKRGKTDAEIRDILKKDGHLVTIEYIKDLRYLYSRNTMVSSDHLLQVMCDNNYQRFRTFYDIKRFLDNIPFTDIEKQVLELRILQHTESQAKIALMLDISQAVVSRIEANIRVKVEAALEDV